MVECDKLFSVNLNIICTNIIFVCRSGREGTSSVKGKQYGTVDDYAQEYEDLVSFFSQRKLSRLMHF